jgi:hypothetical protein
VCRHQRIVGLFHGRGKPETALDPQEIVVNGLRNANHTDLQVAPGDLLTQGRSPPQSAVATDGEQDAHVPFHQGVDHIPDVLRTAR